MSRLKNLGEGWTVVTKRFYDCYTRSHSTGSAGGREPACVALSLSESHSQRDLRIV